MAHFTILYYALCFSAGIGSLIFFVFVYWRYKVLVIRYYLYLNMLLTLHLSLGAFNIYRNFILGDESVLLSVITGTLYMVWYSILFYVLPNFFYNLIGIPLAGYRKLFFRLLSVAAFMLSYIPLFISGDMAEKYRLIYFLLNQVNVYILMGVAIYLLGMVVFNLKKIRNKEALKLLWILVGLIAVFIPAFIADANHVYQNLRANKNFLLDGFVFTPLFYFCWNVIGVVYALQYLLSGPEKRTIHLLRVSGIEVSPSLIQSDEYGKSKGRLFVVDKIKSRHKTKDSE